MPNVIILHRYSADDPLFWRPNETLLMDITVERTQNAKPFNLN